MRSVAGVFDFGARHVAEVFDFGARRWCALERLLKAEVVTSAPVERTRSAAEVIASAVPSARPSLPSRPKRKTSATCRLPAGITLLVLTLTFCAGDRDQRERVELWALGREGEVVAQLVPEFERRNPGIRVDVQQMPWTAAHEKLLTAYVGESTPDVAQVGNTWIPEFVAIHAIDPLDAFVAQSTEVKAASHFSGIWATNVVDKRLYGIPWYVDTRLIFYRTDILARAGYAQPPRTWTEWVDAMQKIRAASGGKRWAILLPTNEWTQPVILGAALGAPLLGADGTRGAFSEPRFARAFAFYVSLFDRGFAPVLSNSQVANLYQQFSEGDFAMYITGPWNVGEFRRRLPAEMQTKWATTPMPSPDDPTRPGVSLAGGSSLVVFRDSKHKSAAWKLIEFLSEPQQQVRFYELTGDLPARRESWSDPKLANDPPIAAFKRQLEYVAPMPPVPQWEQITTEVYGYAESAIRHDLSVTAALKALDAKTDRILVKRRWMVEKERDGR